MKGQLVKNNNHDKSVQQSHLETPSRLQNKLTDQSANNKKVEQPLHTPEQNGDTGTDINSLEAAITKQVCTNILSY